MDVEQAPKRATITPPVLKNATSSLPTSVKLMSTWFKKGCGVVLGILAGTLVVGNAMAHLANGLVRQMRAHYYPMRTAFEAGNNRLIYRNIEGSRFCTTVA